MQPITYTILNQVFSTDFKTLTIFFQFSDGSEPASVSFNTVDLDPTKITKWADDRANFLTQRQITMQQQAEVLQEQLLEQELNNQ